MIRFFHLNNLFCSNVSTNYVILIFRGVPFFLYRWDDGFLHKLYFVFFFRDSSICDKTLFRHFNILDQQFPSQNVFITPSFSTTSTETIRFTLRGDSTRNLLRLRTLTSNNTTLHDQHADTRSVHGQKYVDICSIHTTELSPYLRPQCVAVLCFNVIYPKIFNNSGSKFCSE